MTRRTVFAVAALFAAAFVLTPAAQQRQPAHELPVFQPAGSVAYTLVPVHGSWSADYEKGAGGKLIQVLTIDGMTSKPMAPNPADVRALWGADGEGFLKAATAPGAFSLAIARDVKAVNAGALTVQFKLIAGQTDQSAGIAFGIQPNGSYYFARYNTKDGNVAIWKFENGARTVLAHGAEHEQLKLGEWHELEVRIAEKQVEAVANKTLTVRHALEAPSGRVGVWTKNDSVTSFRNFRAFAHDH